MKKTISKTYHFLRKILTFNAKKNYKYIPYSYSKIDLWRHCPYKFKLQYVNNIRLSYSTNLAIIRGNYLHYCLENKNDGNSFTITEIFTKDEKQNALEVLNKFRNSKIGVYYLSQDGKHEVEFGIKKSKTNIYEVCSFNHNNTLFKGKIDFLFKKENTLYMIDWKSGKYKEEQNYNQLQLYSIWGFLQDKSIQTILCSYVYLEHNVENLIEFKRDELQKNIEMLESMIQNIEHDIKFIKNETMQCEYCDFRKLNKCSK